MVGLEHEMQHQELLVYDIKNLLVDLYRTGLEPPPPSNQAVNGMAEIEGGLFFLGYGHELNEQSPSRNYDFAFDNEKPSHQVFLNDFGLDRALVSNRDFLEFIRIATIAGGSLKAGKL